MLIDASVRRPVIRYHGGKWRLAPWVIEHFPPHRVYVEPFGGGGSVLMRKARSKGEVYNDLWGRIVDVFRVLRDDEMGAELARRLYLTPFARSEFAAAVPEAFETDDIIERARLTIIRGYMGHGSEAPNETSKTGFRSNSMQSNTAPAVEWSNYPVAVKTFVERLRGVIIENKPAHEVMQAFDCPDCLHYVDPPYVHETRNMRHSYAEEMTNAQHEDLAAVLRGLTGMVVLSGYGCPLYDDQLYSGWRRIETAALADSARERTEVLWINDAAAAALDRARLPLFR